MPRRRLLTIYLLAYAFAIITGTLTPTPARVDDRHGNYYYTPINNGETFRAWSPVMKNANREMRIVFTVAQAISQQKRGYLPLYAVFTKSDDAEKLIIVGLYSNALATHSRAVACLLH